MPDLPRGRTPGWQHVPKDRSCEAVAGHFRSRPIQSDKREADRYMFKVPSLRNIEKTGPYFHNGKIATLKEAIAKMADHQVGKTLSDAEIQSIETWMKSLTGVIPADYIKQPEL